MTTEQMETLRKTSHQGYIVSDSKGVGLMEALEQAGEGQHVYERLGKRNSVGLDHNERLRRALGTMTALCRLKYGNLDAEVYAEIEKSEALWEEVTAYNAAQLAIAEKWADEHEQKE